MSQGGGVETSRQQGFDVSERLRLGQLGEYVAQVGVGVVSGFVSWDYREYLSEYSVDGLPRMTEQSGSRPEPAGLPFP